jgi:hypothetical protein
MNEGEEYQNQTTRRHTMLILLRDTDLDGQPIIGSGLLVAGENALEIVQKMQATSPFNAGDVTVYMRRVLEAAGEEGALPDDGEEATARHFLERLAAHGLVVFRSEDSNEDSSVAARPGAASSASTLSIITSPEAPPSETALLAQLEQALLTIRDSGLTNMFDHPEVARLARKFGFADVADWIAAHPGDYVQLLLSGGAKPLRDNFVEKEEDGQCAD